MKEQKSISVAMCTYNGEKYIGEQLESIANQTRLPSEVVICDDRSTDSTPEIITSFAKTAPFKVVYVENPKNLGSAKKGITRNFEQATLLCTGDLIAMSDQDDKWLPEKMARLAERLEQKEKPGGVFSDARLIDNTGKPTGVLLSETSGLNRKEQARLNMGESLPILLAMNKVYGCTLMFDSRLVSRFFPVPPHWWFDAWVANMIGVYSGLDFVEEPLFFYRIHESQFFGAAVPTVTERIQQWKSPAKLYLEEAEPQLMELYERLEQQNDPQLEPHLEYLRGRLALLRLRADFPSNRLTRLTKVLPQTANYHRYFNGWKSIVKDLTV